MIGPHEPSDGLRRVPITSELARVGSTAWQIARGGGNVVGASLRLRPLTASAVQEAREVLSALGPTYVKFGQIIGSSSGFFPRTLSDELRSLLDSVPPADPDAVHALLERELGASPNKIFASFDATPAASASIAQVHFAVLKSGERVAVKIQRPGIRSRIAADVQLFERVAAVLHRTPYVRMLNPRAVIEDFAVTLQSELDFTAEARASADWSAGLAPTRFGRAVRVPTAHPKFTTSRVLTMERVDGIRIDDIEAIEAAKLDGTELVRTLFLSFLETLLRVGVFRGDLHAGNVLVDENGKLVFLDFGVVGRLDTDRRAILRRMLVSLLLLDDFDAAGQALFELGAVRKPKTALGSDVSSAISPLRDNELGEASYLDFGRRLAELARVHDAKLPRELVLVLKQLLYVERYVKLLAPQWKPTEDHAVIAYLASLLTDTDQMAG